MTESPLRAHPDGTLVRVWVVPRASRTELRGLHDGRVRIRVMAPPEAGRANDQVTCLLADRLGVPVELVSGASRRDKVFLARGIGIGEAAAILSP
ncbi:MAG: DUF167 domain-containing protein [Acidimicrobiia bacterium]